MHQGPLQVVLFDALEGFRLSTRQNSIVLPAVSIETIQRVALLYKNFWLNPKTLKYNNNGDFGHCSLNASCHLKPEYLQLESQRLGCIGRNFQEKAEELLAKALNYHGPFFLNMNPYNKTRNHGNTLEQRQGCPQGLRVEYLACEVYILR